MVNTHWKINDGVMTYRLGRCHWLIPNGVLKPSISWSASPLSFCFLVSLGLSIGLGNATAAQATMSLKTQAKQCPIASTSPSGMRLAVKGCDRLPMPESTVSAPTESRTSPPQLLLSDRFAAANLRPETIPLQPTFQAQAETSGGTSSTATSPPTPVLDIEPQIIEDSPVLQRWLEEIPDIATDVKYDPAFRTRLQVGYAQFPSSGQTGGIHIGIQDVFVGQTPLTISAEYAANVRGDSELFGVDAQYYLLPLGWYGNIAPVLGYRSVETPDFDSSGLNVGFRLILIPSRGGGADLSLTQTWVAPGSDDVIGITTFSAGYAVTPELRLATDIQTQNAADNQESRVSILLEWML